MFVIKEFFIRLTLAMEFALKYFGDYKSPGLMTPTSKQIAYGVGVFRF
jgi:hypothetical protein